MFSIPSTAYEMGANTTHNNLMVKKQNPIS